MLLPSTCGAELPDLVVLVSLCCYIKTITENDIPIDSFSFFVLLPKDQERLRADSRF